MLCWLLLAPLTALPVLAGSSDVGATRLLAEVVGLATLGAGLGLFAPGPIGRATPWAGVGVVAPAVSALGLPWAARVALEAGAWAFALTLVGLALHAARRGRPAAAPGLLALLGLGLLQLDPLALGTLRIRIIQNIC